MRGTVTKLVFKKQYLFISGIDGQTYFAHFSNLEDALLPCDEMLVGYRVQFDPAEAPAGKSPRALNIVGVPEATP